MKSLLAILLLFLAIQVRAATPSFGDFTLSQFKTNGNKVYLKDGASLTNPVVNNLIGTNTGFVNNMTNNSLVVTNAAFINNNTNANLSVSNSASVNTITVTNTATFNGKVNLTSNVFLNSLNFGTNAASMGTTLNLNGGYQDSSTNNNVLYTGFTFLSGTGDTNIAWTSVLLTNTSGSIKTIGFLGCVGDTNVYITNQTAFTVLKYPGRGTNVVGRPLN